MVWLLSLGGASLCAGLNVVASNGIVADWVRQVGGSMVVVTTFADAGADPHHFEPSPRQLGQLGKADLVVAFGAGLETWLDDAITASGSHAMVLELTDGLDLMEPGEPFWLDMPMLYADAEHKPPCCKEDALEANEKWAAMIPLMPTGHAGHDHHGHDHAEYDPHVWLDPQQVVLMVLMINTALVELDPQNALKYDQRREAYLNKLIELDEWAEARLGEIPASRRILINYHDNLRYFGRRYGFFTPMSILGNVSTEAPDPSAKQFAHLLKFIRKLNVPAVFYDASANPRLAEQVALESKLPPPDALYTGNLTPPDGAAPDYLTLMRVNVETITSALR